MIELQGRKALITGAAQGLGNDGAYRHARVQ